MPRLSSWRKARPLVSEDQFVSESEPLRSSHPGSIGGATPHVGEVQIGAVNRVANHQQLPAPAQPAYAIGQLSIARRTLEARKCTTELCRYLEPVFAALEAPRKNTRHNSRVGIRVIVPGVRNALREKEFVKLPHSAPPSTRKKNYARKWERRSFALKLEYQPPSLRIRPPTLPVG